MTQLETLVQFEDRRLHLIRGTVHVKHFCTNVTHWELLLLLHKLDGDPKYGLNDYIDNLSTLTQTRLTIQTFIKQTIKQGLFEVVPSEKKSRKTLVLSSALTEELETTLAQIWAQKNE